MKAYSYLRFSTPEQQKGDSTRRQSALAQKYAEDHALELDDELTFQDLGVSAFRGRNAETGKLGEFLEAVGSGLVEKGSYLLVESLDRISRKKAILALNTLQSICLEGITVVTLMDGREYTADGLLNDPTSLIMSILIFIRANEESETKSSRIKASWVNKRSKMKAGEVVPAALPAWLRIDLDTKTFQVLEDKAEVVQRIFTMALEGKGINGIVRVLNREGVENFGSGKHWYSSYVWNLLHLPIVTGDFIPYVIDYENGKKVKKAQSIIENYYPAIIDRDTYAQVQNLAKSKSPLRGRNANSQIKNIFGGLAKCPVCGSTMSLLDKGKRGYTYMVCSKARVGKGCNYTAVRYEKLEEAFISAVNHGLGIPIGNQVIDDRLETLSANLDALQDARAELLEKLQGKSNPVFTRMIKDIEAEITQLEQQQQAMIPEIVSRKDRLLELNVARMEEACKEIPLDKGKLNTALRQLLKSVVIDYESKDLVLEWKHDGETRLVYEYFPKQELRRKASAKMATA